MGVAFFAGGKTLNSTLSNLTSVSNKKSSFLSDNAVTIWDVEAAYEEWAKSAGPYFRESLGLASAFAVPAARLYIALWAAGLNPRISRGWSDPSHQAKLRADWDAGRRAGLRVRPADPANSAHCKTTFLGTPDSKAVDMPCSDDKRAAQIATNIGVGAGLNFSVPDPGHYYLLGG